VKLKLDLSESLSRKTGRNDFQAGLPREAASQFFSERSLAFREWLAGWDEENQSRRFMQFTISKSVLLKELQLLQGVAMKKSAIPILANVLLEVSGGDLAIKATDLDISFTTRCAVESKGDGSLCLSSKKLFDIVRALPEAEISFQRDEADAIVIRCERSRFKLHGLPSENFPEVQSVEAGFIPFPAEMLRAFIGHTQFAITAEESRHTLNGAKFEVNGKCRMVTTDGHRLSLIEADASDALALDILIPKKALAEVARLCAETDESIELAHTGNQVHFRLGKRLLSSRLLEGQFPQYQLILPKENTIKIEVPNNRISAAVNRVALMANDQSHAIRVDIVPGTLTVVAPPSELGDADEIIPIEYEGEPLSFAVNAEYFMDFFAVAQEGEVLIELKDGQSQILMRNASGQAFDFRYVVMPMRL
jgi:DNA polymerase-3 subunit beta